MHAIANYRAAMFLLKKKRKAPCNTQQIHYFSNSVIEPKGMYKYDALYRLNEATGRELTSLQLPTHEDLPDNIGLPNTSSNAMQNYTQQYTYDELGNIMQMKSVGNWTRDYFYNTNDNKLLGHTDGTTEYTYDAHGNILTMPHLQSLIWDFKDELKEVTLNASGDKAYYVYDASGNRVRKVVVKSNIVEERFYLGDYEVFRKTNTGTLEIERSTVFISDDQKRIAMVDNDGTIETIRYQIDNHLRSASLELDQNAVTISYEEYHPFGTTSYRSGRFETEVSLKRYKYVGKERDEETGLYYYGARYYAGWIGRFISTDPMKAERTWLTPYNYCQNNPINRTDPTGALDDDPPMKGVNPELYEDNSTAIKSNKGSKLAGNPYSDAPSVTSSVKKTKNNNPLGVKIRGFDQNIIAEEIDKVSDLTITWDSETNKLLASGEAVTDKDKLLFEAINNLKIEVNLLNSDQDIVTVDGNMALNDIGGFGGNREIIDSSGNKTVRTMQFFNLKQAKQEQNEGGNKIGTNAIHEILESYIAAKLHPNVKAPVNASNTPANANAYLESHKRASDIDPDFKERVPQAGGGYIYKKMNYGTR